MAFAASQVCDTVFGNMRVVVFDVTPDGTAGTVVTGLNRVAFAQVSQKSGITQPNVAINQLESGTAALGTVALTSAVSSNVSTLIVFGS